MRLEQLDDDLTYSATALDREVVAEDQIRTVMKAFRDNLFTSDGIFPGRTEVPKTLIFAKDDSHAEDIVRIAREVFNKGNDFVVKITYRTTGRKPEELLQEFRNSYLPRIAVTVDMIATGTDVKPFECVFFMRRVKSRNFFEQMKGRGVRVIDPNDFQQVTPDALAKTHFVIVDAVGTTEVEFTDTQPLERAKTTPLDQLLLRVSQGQRDPDLVSSIAGRLARLERQITKDDRDELRDAAGGTELSEFLKMADEQTKPPFTRPAIVPAGLDWQSLVDRDGDELEAHYIKVLNELGKQSGMLGTIFRKAQNRIQDPAKLRRLIVNLIGGESWMTLDADVKGDAYEGLLERGATDTKTGAGQYFTPRALIRGIVDVMQPRPDDTVADPACGTGGFLLAAYEYITKHNPVMDPDQKRHLRTDAFRGWEIGDGTARLCAMNMLLHGIGAPDGDSPIRVEDSLAGDPSERFSMVLANPPFGRKSSMTMVTDEGQAEKEDLVIFRDDFWASTSNKQLNFVQHIKTILAMHGRAAVVVPDNVLFEGGAGETIRRKLLHDCDVHTMLRLPTGIFYKPGVKANVLFFDRKPASEHPWSKDLWIYDLPCELLRP